jgi:FkbM family methyltransferase
MFDEKLGKLESVNGRDILTTVKDRSGVALWGPYTHLPAGRYLAECALTAEACDTLSGMIEIIANSEILGVTHIYPSRLNSEQDRIFLPFNMAKDGVVEVRFHIYGYAALHIDLQRNFIRLDDDQLNFSPMLPPDAPLPDQFFRDHLSRVRDLYEAGAAFSIAEQGSTKVRLDGVSFLLKNHEDFQIVHEIFLVNEYTSISAGKKIIVDVGMNIGLASLKMAGDPNVLEVHSFEPFKAPFTRALENLELNPDLARKITPYNFGLAGADEETEVSLLENATLSNSIKGRYGGGNQWETIRVRDASTALRPIIEKAEHLGAEVIIKLDCEGSEFPIFESFDKNGFFPRIQAFMVEWHKWWSADKTMSTLAAPLLANGYVVFNRTNPVDRWAGHFVAVRAEDAESRLAEQAPPAAISRLSKRLLSKWRAVR